MMNPKQDVEGTVWETEHLIHRDMDVRRLSRLESSSVAKEEVLSGGSYTVWWLAVLDCSLVILGLLCIFSVLNVVHIVPGLVETQLVLANVVLVGVFGSLFRYMSVAEGRYSLGKALFIAAHLVFYNALMIFGLTRHISVPELLVLSSGFGCMALVSAWYHVEFSQPYTVAAPKSLACRLEKKIKRIFDWSAAVLGMIAISPLLALCFSLLILEGKGSPIFRQTRIGKGAEPFQMFKFRSMIQDADLMLVEQKPVLHKCKNDPRITALGRIIRKLSVDELPQLWNVVRGEMSLVGPRPPLPSEYAIMNAYHRRKFEATPGLTGLWQVVGRVKNQRDFNSVALYDTQYLENWCLLEDIRILLKTIPVVLLQKGAS